MKEKEKLKRYDKTLGSIRMTSQDIASMNKAIKMFNQSNDVFEISLQGYRRWCYRLLTQLILNGKDIPVKFKVNP